MSLNANNLRAWREAAGLQRDQLAAMLGVTATSIYRIEKGTQQPRTELLAKICTTFGKKPSEFPADEIPSDQPPLDVNVEPAPRGDRSIPVWDFVQAGDFNVIQANPHSEDRVMTTLQPSPGTFGLWIRGRSMEPTFKEGDLVIIDPVLYPRAEDYVVAENEQGEGTFKKFHNAGLNAEGKSVFELVSLNPAYPTWRSDRMRISIRGTMIEHRRFRRR